MRYSEIINQNTNVTEVKTITHGPEDDTFWVKKMNRLFDINKDRHNLLSITNIDGIDAISTHWPLEFNNHIFFMDNETLIGFTTIQENSYKGHPEIEIGYIIRIIFLIPEYTNQGIGTKFYQFLLDSGIILEADSEQTVVAQNLWNKLSKMPQYDLRIYDDVTFMSKK